MQRRGRRFGTIIALASALAVGASATPAAWATTSTTTPSSSSTTTPSSSTPSSSAPSSSTTSLPVSTVPPSTPAPVTIDLTALQAEQVQVVSRDYQSGISQAGTTLETSTATLTAARSRLSDDTATEATMATRVAAADQALTDVTDDHISAVAAHNQAQSTVASDRDALAQIGLALYIGPPPTVPDLPDVGSAQASADGQTYLSVGQQQVSGALDRDTRRAVTTGAHEQELAATMGKDQGTLDQDQAASTAAQARVAGDKTAVTRDQATVTQNQQRLTEARQAQTAAVAAVDKPAPDGSPTILGAPALEASQLAGWFSTGYYQDGTTAPIAALAGWYVNDGRMEGVRGDIAFAQAIVETGGFASPDAVNLDNFAGIGHCDSCAAGLAFPGPQAGVIGHLQLLRIFASPPGTPLPQPAAIPAVAPGGQFRGACCTSWQSLTGTWATDPSYGSTVLSIYKSILDYALSQPPVAPPAPSAVPAAGRP